MPYSATAMTDAASNPQVAAIQDAGHPTCRFRMLHTLAKNALPVPGVDQLPPLARPDVGSLPDVFLDRFLCKLAIHFHADSGLAVLHLPV